MVEVDFIRCPGCEDIDVFLRHMLNDVDIFVLHPLQMSWHMLTHYFQVLDTLLLWFNPSASILNFNIKHPYYCRIRNLFIFIPYIHQGFWDWEVFQLLSCHILERYKSHTCCYAFPIKDPACLAKIPMVRQLHIIHLYDLCIPVGGLEHTFSFSVIIVIIPTDELHHFSEG